MIVKSKEKQLEKTERKRRRASLTKKYWFWSVLDYEDTELFGEDGRVLIGDYVELGIRENEDGEELWAHEWHG